MLSHNQSEKYSDERASPESPAATTPLVSAYHNERRGDLVIFLVVLKRTFIYLPIYLNDCVARVIDDAST